MTLLMTQVSETSSATLYLFINFSKLFFSSTEIELQALNHRTTEQDETENHEYDRSVNSDGEKPEKQEEILNELSNDDYDSVSTTWDGNYLISHWTEPGTMVNRLNVAVLLPTGTTRSSFKIHVYPQGRILEVSVDFPKPPHNMHMLHNLFLDSTQIYDSDEVALAIGGFEKSLTTRRELKDSKVLNTCEVFLPFKVSTDFTYNYLGWNRDSSMVVCVK